MSVNVRGNTRDPNRGNWCTPKPVAEALGLVDLDPFSNPRARILSDAACWLEHDDDGFGDGTPGSYKIAGRGMFRATANTLVFLQPPYAKGFADRVITHYGHTRFIALLRFDPRPPWFHRLYRLSGLVGVFRGGIEFEPPPGVSDGGGNSFPHAIFARSADDVRPELLRKLIAWRTGHGP